jgi:drug/metabolite transporter (DMT)-like permease
MYLMRRAGAVMASSYAYVNPPIALIAGAWLLDEQISSTTVLATIVVLIGAATVVLSTPPKRQVLVLPPQPEFGETR